MPQQNQPVRVRFILNNLEPFIAELKEFTGRELLRALNRAGLYDRDITYDLQRRTGTVWKWGEMYHGEFHVIRGGGV